MKVRMIIAASSDGIRKHCVGDVVAVSPYVAASWAEYGIAEILDQDGALDGA
jgi:hypothetical protein